MILVTGGTGFTGGRIIRLLRGARLDVRALVRPGSYYYWLNDTGCSYHFGDLRDARSLKRATRGCRFVIHAAGVRVESTDNHHGNVTLQGTKDLVDVAVERGVEHFVFVSCLHAGASTPAFAHLAAAEEHLAASGLSYTILRPTLTTEEIAELGRELRQGKEPRVWGRPEARVNPISRKDVALYALAALDHPAARNTTLQLGGPEEMSVGEAVAAAEELGGGKVRWTGKMAGPASHLARVAGRRWKHWIDRQSILWGQDGVVDMSATSATFGLPLTPFADALREAVEEVRLGDDPADREEKVVHRQFQATVYEPGVVDFKDLPEGPLRLDD